MLAAQKCTSVRSSGVELLKVFAIVIIVCSHVVQTLQSIIPLNTATTDIPRLVLTMLRYSGAMGNSLFFVCSAWFLLDSEGINQKKIVSMLLDIWVVSVFIFAIVFLLKDGDLPWKMILKSFFPTTFSTNWYMTCYLLFYPVHPVLNKIISDMTQKVLLKVTLSLSVLYIVLPYLSVSGSPFFMSSLILWLTIYFVVAYIKFYLPQTADSVKINIAALFIGIVGNCGIILVTNFLGLRVSLFADKLLYWNKNCSPFLILTAIAALNLARQAHFTNKCINYISKLSLLIYIIHENLLLRTYYRPMLWQYIYDTYGYSHILLWVFLMVIVLFLFGFLASVFYSLTVQKLTKPLSRKLTVLLTTAYQKWENRLLKLNSPT